MKRRHCFLFGVFILLFALTGCFFIPSNPYRQTLEVNGQYVELESHMETLLENKPNPPTTELYYLCRAYSELQKFDKLFPCLDKLETNIEGGDDSVFGIIGGVAYAPDLMRSQAYLELGQFENAILYGKRAWETVEPWNHIRATYTKIITLEAYSLALILGGKPEKARKLIATMKNLSGLATSENKATSLARVYMALGDYQKALEAAEDKYSVGYWLLKSSSWETGWNYYISELPNRFIRDAALVELGRYEEAKADLDDLLARPETKGSGTIYWQMLYNRARIAAAEGRPIEARDFLAQAVEVIESQRATIGNDASKIGFVGNKQSVYNLLIEILVEQGNYDEAFQYAERAKARALVDMLASKDQFGGEQIDTAELANLLKELEQAEEDLQRLVYYAPTEEKQSQLRAVVVQKRRQIAKTAPETTSLVAVSPPSIEEIQSLLLKQETLIEFYGGEDKVFAFVLDGGSVQAVILDGRGLEGSINAFRKAVQDPKAGDDPREHARGLYQRLLEPMEGHIKTNDLVIVPHGALHYLPFAALHTGQGYLIDTYNVRVLPSASVMKFLKKGKGGKVGTALVLGNPDLGDAKLDLPFAQAEAQIIGELLPDSKVLIRSHATETAARKYGRGFKYVHFASHGVFNPAKPLASGLLLARDVKNDGMLTVSELYDIELDADLVTLSACETALGYVANGDDVVGFTRGFLYAGANSIVSSLWKVDDEATSELMKAFYANLGKMDKRSALRAAQLTLKNSEKSHPYYWAAFQLTGTVN